MHTKWKCLERNYLGEKGQSRYLKNLSIMIAYPSRCLKSTINKYVVLITVTH